MPKMEYPVVANVRAATRNPAHIEILRQMISRPWRPQLTTGKATDAKS